MFEFSTLMHSLMKRIHTAPIIPLKIYVTRPQQLNDFKIFYVITDDR